MTARRPRVSRIRLAALLTLTLTLFLSGLAQAPATRASLADLPYRLVPGTTSSLGVDQQHLRASGSLIVWQDSRNGLPDIFLYDINDERERRVAKSSEIRRQPAVSGSTVVWINGHPDEPREVRGIDLAEGVEFEISEPGDVAEPAIDYPTVVWQERRNGVWTIMAHDIAAQETNAVASSQHNQAHPDISRGVIVWHGHDGDSWNIYARGADDGSVRQLTTGGSDDRYPRIDGDWVVFVRSHESGGPPEIVLLNLESGAEHSIATGHFVMRPAVASGVVAWEDWRSGLPDIYAWDIARGEMFAVARSQQASTPAVSGDVVAWISGLDQRSQRVQVLRIQERLPTDPHDPPAVPSPENLYVPETHQFVSSGFKAFWQQHGGPRVLGYPLTSEFSEYDGETGAEIVVQYFERVKMEYHPDAPEDERIRLARLGTEFRPEREVDPIAPFESTESSSYFPETGHSLNHGFKAYWEANGGLALFGYPITEEFVENGRVVQYFERARFEYNPDSDAATKVTLGLLGREALQRRGWLPMPPIDTTLLFE